MSKDALLERRLEAVEQAVADLQRQLAPGGPSPNWLDEVIGSITDASAFREILDFGRAFRSGDRFPDEVDEPS